MGSNDRTKSQARSSVQSQPISVCTSVPSKNERDLCMQFIWTAPYWVQQKRRHAGTKTANGPVTRKSLIALEIELSDEARPLLRDDLHVKMPRTRAINNRKDCPEAESASFVRIGFPIELEVAVPVRCARVIRMQVDAAMIRLPNLNPGRRDRCVLFIHKPTRLGQFLPLR